MFGMFFIFVSIASISAGSLDNLGTFKKGECVELTQTCADCSFVNFTQVMYPNSTTAERDISATKDGISFNASFCKTSETGTYKVYGVGDLDGEDTVFAYEFEVTDTGKPFGVGQGIIHAVLFAFLAVLSFVALNMCINTPWDSENDPSKNITNKIIKFVYGTLSYVFMMFVMFTGKGLSQSFLPGDTVYSFFNTFSTIMTVILVPALIMTVFFIGLKIATDKKNMRALRRGLPQGAR